MRTVRVGDVGVRVTPAATQRFPLFPSVGEYPLYDDNQYDTFGAASPRNDAYTEALARAALGRTVLDIGTGRDALWALAAARAGARRVYAVEALPAVAELARKAVRRAGFADRVTVVTGGSQRVSLPERAEVCVSEILGNIASAEGVVAVLDDARRRLCVPDCVWIPSHCATRIAAVSRPGDPTLAEESLPYVAGVFGHVGRPFDLRLCLGGPAHETVISSAGTAETLTFAAAGATSATVTTGLTVTRHAPLTGFLLWVEPQCAPDMPAIDTLRTAERGWAPVYAPVPSPGVALRPGDRIRLRFTRRASDDGVHPDYHLHADGVGEWVSAHHGGGFRTTAFYRQLFPV